MAHLLCPTSFFVMVALFTSGAIGSLALRRSDAWANGWSSAFSMAGSLWGAGLGAMVITSKQGLSFSLKTAASPFFSISFHIDGLSAFFIVAISLIAFLCSLYGLEYVKHYFKKYDIGVLGFFYNLFILGMLGVVSADNALLFLVAWEIMSIASYFLVIYDHRDPENIRAGYLYLVMTHVATAFLILGFLILYKYTGSFQFESLRRGADLLPLSLKNAMFFLALVGFGTKAGMVPFHIWLPGAHPAAPSHVSALMSGVMIKTGVYMMIRMFLDLLQPIPSWWGLTVLAAGAVSSLVGVLFALTEHDLKKLLACHSIENIGIILMGVGASMSFLSMGMPTLALLGLIAALFHILNHAIFKSLLFLSAGAVIRETHTRNMEKYGGLIKLMPQTALFFLIGSMAISALPPFNGFFSEWLTFQGLFQGIATLDFSAKWVFIAAAGSLAFTGGLALTCFVKAFGAAFLARPRSRETRRAKDPSLVMRLSMGTLAGLTLFLGLFSAPVTSILAAIGGDLSVFNGAASCVSRIPLGLSVAGFSTVSGPLLCGMLFCAFFVVLFTVRRCIYGGQKIRIGATWDCGADLTPRMEITATGFARSIITIFKGLLKPSIQHETEYHDAQSRYLPASRMVTLSIKDIHLSYLYKPIRKAIRGLSVRVKAIQTGNINIYILYIFVALLIALALVR